ncbi:ArdC-like ssDNA-binding domain-containing protein, partial [Chloroflexota bacterium]
TIRDKQWMVDIASTSWELSQGLGGLMELATGTGMLFDLGFKQTIQVTTVPMLFPLDIAFLSDDLSVTEVYRSVEPGYLVTSQVPARYFLEVNAGELEGVEPGDGAFTEWLILEDTPVTQDWVPAIFSLAGFMALGVLVVDLAQNVTEKSIVGSERASLCAVDSRMEGCEIVRPRHYDLVSWVGAPVPDYSFTIEPEVKERRIDEVLKRLKEGVDGIQESDNFREFLLTMAKFHNYSIGNLILITIQRPDSTRVAGYNTWKDLGRWVKKGEKGIAILAPCLPPKSARVTEPDEESDEEDRVTEIRPLYFKVVHVFDVSQTEGKPLLEFEVPDLTGEANEDLFSSAMRLAKSQGLDVNFESRPGQDPAIKGMYSGISIWIRPEESRAQQLKTLLHEIAHYYSEGVFRMLRRNAETIAESVAFTVGAHYGFDTGVRSFPYVALWAEDKKVLEQNLADIRKVSTRIIDALKTEVAKVAVTS